VRLVSFNTRNTSLFFILAITSDYFFSNEMIKFCNGFCANGKIISNDFTGETEIWVERYYPTIY
jgi:hypothetical protein